MSWLPLALSVILLFFSVCFFFYPFQNLNMPSWHSGLSRSFSLKLPPSSVMWLLARHAEPLLKRLGSLLFHFLSSYPGRRWDLKLACSVVFLLNYNKVVFEFFFEFVSNLFHRMKLTFPQGKLILPVTVNTISKWKVQHINFQASSKTWSIIVAELFPSGWTSALSSWVRKMIRHSHKTLTRLGPLAFPCGGRGEGYWRWGASSGFSLPQLMFVERSCPLVIYATLTSNAPTTNSKDSLAPCVSQGSFREQNW